VRDRLVALTRNQRRYLAFELVLAAGLTAVALALKDGSDTAHFFAVVCAGYAIGLIVHPIAVMAGWRPRREREARSRRRES
jgi:hypothetical protein